MQDPEIYLDAIDSDLNCVVYPDKVAILDPEHRSLINYEAFFFADAKAKAEFERDRFAHCGILTDPVSRQRFHPTTSSPHLEHEGHPFYFVSEETRALFEMMPDMYALPNYEMLPRDSTAIAPEES